MNSTAGKTNVALFSNHKQEYQDIPEIKKLQFSHKRTRKCLSLASTGVLSQKTNNLIVKRSKRSKLRTSSSSCSESEICSEENFRESRTSGVREQEIFELWSPNLIDFVDNTEKKAYCSTPIGRNNIQKERLVPILRSSALMKKQGTPQCERIVNSTFDTSINAVVKGTSFHGDDGDLAALNLSEIIARSARLEPVRENSCCSFSEPFPDTENGKWQMFYGLPMTVKELLHKYRGIESLYDWQTDCLNLAAVQERKNLIYSLPTSGGKTLVAEILIFKELLLQQKDVLFILPFVSIVQEKVKSLAQFAVDLGFLVEEYAASRGKIPPRKRRKKKSVYVATIEKANSLVNSLIGEDRLSSLGLVVVDELHMLGDDGRGAILEMCLAKLLFVTPSTQVIGMSATLSNIGDLRKFLKAEMYCSDFRPVELQEYVKVGSDIFKVPKPSELEEQTHQLVRQISHKKMENKQQLLKRDPDHLVPLVLEVIPQHSCLVFCPTKKNCQTLAVMLAQFMPRDMCLVKASERCELMKAVYNEASGLCPVLRQVIPYGIAYHHSGLTMDERKLIEDAYSQGVLSLLTCTSTLAAGVNLPAKRVIVRAPYVGSSLLRQTQYKQMVGRAGRAGIDTSGESILIVSGKDESKVGHLFSGPLEGCNSKLLSDGGKGLRALILTLVGLKLCSTEEELKDAMNGTLLSVQTDSPGDLERYVDVAMESLTQLGHVVKSTVLKTEGDDRVKVEVTQLGQATFKGCIDIDNSPIIYRGLTRTQENVVLTNELHVLYLVTPLDLVDSVEPEWMTYFQQLLCLDEVEQKAAGLIGVTEGLLTRKATGRRVRKDETVEETLRRFYLTLILYKLLKGTSVWKVAEMFHVTRGFVQSLMSSASSFASCMVFFTRELSEFWALNLLLEAMVKKLSYTASLELVPLMEVPGVKQARARQLFKLGFKSLSSLAWADADLLVQQVDHLSRRQALQIVSAAKMLLQEKADALREEAEEMVLVPAPVQQR